MSPFKPGSGQSPDANRAGRDNDLIILLNQFLWVFDSRVPVKATKSTNQHPNTLTPALWQHDRNPDRALRKATLANADEGNGQGSQNTPDEQDMLDEDAEDEEYVEEVKNKEHAEDEGDDEGGQDEDDAEDEGDGEDGEDDHNDEPTRRSGPRSLTRANPNTIRTPSTFFQDWFYTVGGPNLMNGKGWTEQEDLLLLDLYEQGME